MLSGIAAQHGLGGQHLDQAAQATHEGDLARLAIFVRLPSAQFGPQLHFGLLEGDPFCIFACFHDSSFQSA